MAVYAISDLHGSLNLFQQIQSYIKKEDKVYVLGDCGDRGMYPWHTIIAVAKDPRFIYLKGNHENMLVNAFKKYKLTGDFNNRSSLLLFHNGGYDTLLGLSSEENADEWCSYLEKRPVLDIYKNKDGIKIYLCHAGFTPYEENPVIFEDDLLWDRNHYFDNIDKIKCEDSAVVVHGHTPTKYICYDLDLKIPEGALRYANGKKICIDCANYDSGKTVLLNLDTFEEIIFKET